MSRRRQRPLALLCLAAFLVANGPLRVPAAGHCCNHHGSAPESCCTPPAPAPAVVESEAACDCCCCHAAPAAPTEERSIHPGDSKPSECPFCPCCPNGCCWRCAAKAPCSLPSGCLPSFAEPCLGPCAAEARLQLPLPPALELLQVPRA